MRNGSNNLRRLGDLEIDLEKKIIWVKGQSSGLPAKAVELLCVLIENEGEVISKDELLNRVWSDSFVEEGVLPQNVYLLRKTLSSHGLNGDLIQTVPRRGYRFVADRGEGNVSSEITIEHEIVEQNFISETEYSPVASQAVDTATQTKRASLFRRPTTFLAGLLGLLAVGAFAINWNWNQQAPTPKGRISFAVAPFMVIQAETGSESATQKGLAEALIFQTKRIRNFEVAALSHVEPYFGKSIDGTSFGQQLGASFVLTGAIRKENESYRISFDLIRVESGEVALNDSVTIKSTENSDIETAAALLIARKVDIFAAAMRNENEIPSGALAEQTKAAYILAQRIPRENDLNRWSEAAGLMRKVVDAAPNWALAHAKLAEALVLVQGESGCREARLSAEKALQLDPNTGDAMMVLGACDMNERRWDEAEMKFRSAIEMNPGLDRGYVELGMLLDYSRRFAEAETYLLKALELEPLSPYYNVVMCQHYYYDKRWVDATNYCGQAIQIEPGYFLAKKRFTWIYVMQNRYDLVAINDFGISSIEELRRNRLTRPLADGDIKGYWQDNLEDRLANKGKRSSPTALAAYYAMLGDVEKAIDLLEEAERINSDQLRFLYADPLWDPLRREPRYKELIRKIGLGDGRFEEEPKRSAKLE